MSGFYGLIESLRAFTGRSRAPDRKDSPAPGEEANDAEASPRHKPQRRPDGDPVVEFWQWVWPYYGAP